MWKILVILSLAAFVQSCRVIEQKANGVQIERSAHTSHVLIEAFLTFELKYLCSGVIVSANFVLTSNNCLFGANFANVHVYAYKLRDVFEDNREIYRSENIIRHPDFDGLYHINDVALIKLPVTLNVAARPYSIAQLPDTAFAPGVESKLVGWGLLSFVDDNAAAFTQEQDMITLTDSYCSEKFYGWAEGFSQGRACAMRTAGTNCVADSGSPLMVGDVVRGFHAWGNTGACAEGTPDGIIDVFYFADWIRENIESTFVASLKF